MRPASSNTHIAWCFLGWQAAVHCVREEYAGTELWGCPMDGHTTNAWHTTQNCVGSSPDTAMIY